ncbi:MAG: hypothetical protein ABW046_23145, partial [Actinoplanes sp.]
MTGDADKDLEKQGKRNGIAKQIAINRGARANQTVSSRRSSRGEDRKTRRSCQASLVDDLSGWTNTATMRDRSRQWAWLGVLITGLVLYV